MPLISLYYNLSFYRFLSSSLGSIFLVFYPNLPLVIFKVGTLFPVFYYYCPAYYNFFSSFSLLDFFSASLAANVAAAS
jgi:hypothetical protein